RTGMTSRHLQEHFQRSGDTILKYVSDLIKWCLLIYVHRCVHCIVNMLVTPPMYTNYVKLLDDVTPSQIAENPKLFPFFKDCRGAIDGSPIHAFVPDDAAPRYRN
ncbi:hypothetical protein BV22DRAFT_991331, partial [Leucogyrophana mollusca]